MEDSASSSAEQPIDRALAVLTYVATIATPVSVTEIAYACGLPVPTAHRLVAQLRQRGLLKRSLGSKKVVVGEALLHLSLQALEASTRADRPHQVLLALSADLGEHVHLGIRSGNDVLYVSTARAPSATSGLQFEPGRRAPLYCTSIGKIYLADMPEQEFTWWLSQFKLVALTPNTITTPKKLRSVIADVRKSGWAVSSDEFATGVVGCAVPVRNAAGKLMAGLGVSVPNARMPAKDLVTMRPRLEAAAFEISKSMSE